TPKKVEWLWPNRLAIGKNNLVCGDPGLGKSLWSLDVAARVSRGEGFPDSHDERRDPGGVVILTMEDDDEDTIVPRLVAHNADLSRIVHVKGITEVDGDGEQIHAIDLAQDIQSIRAAVEQVKNCKLVIVDTISDYMGSKTDAHKNRDVRSVLNPFAAMANECRVANLCISHLRKGEGRAIHSAMGSIGFVGQCRVAWAITRCPTNSRRRLMTCIKNNLADDTSGLAFTIEPYGPDNGPVLAWEAEPVRMSADQAMDQLRSKPGRKPDARRDANDWLREQLSFGPVAAGEILDAAKDRYTGDCSCVYY
ncbi:MAG TPA: AAA family ATPase, partial [Lacipirellulaceae bacterium]